MNFGEKLRVVRHSLGLSQQELADRLGTTKQAISRYENSERDPNLRTAKAFSEKLGIDLTVLADEDLYLPSPEKIYSERVRRGWSLAQFSEMTKINEERLGSLEAGECFPSALELSIISKSFSSSSDWLLGLDWAPANTVPSLNCEELDIILAYRRASADIKSAVRLILEKSDQKRSN